MTIRIPEEFSESPCSECDKPTRLAYAHIHPPGASAHGCAPGRVLFRCVLQHSLPREARCSEDGHIKRALLPHDVDNCADLQPGCRRAEVFLCRACSCLASRICRKFAPHLSRPAHSKRIREATARAQCAAFMRALLCTRAVLDDRRNNGLTWRMASGAHAYRGGTSRFKPPLRASGSCRLCLPALPQHETPTAGPSQSVRTSTRNCAMHDLTDAQRPANPASNRSGCCFADVSCAFAQPPCIQVPRSRATQRSYVLAVTERSTGSAA